MAFVRAGAPDVIPRRAPKRVNLLRIDGALRDADLRGCARFHLDKDEPIAFPRDDVDFSAALRGAPVARHDGKTQLAQVAVGEIFAAFSQILEFAVSNPIGEPVKRRQRVQTRTPSPCRAPDSTDKTPRTSGNAGSG